MHSDSVFSPPRYYKSFTCPNEVSLLFGLNSKLVHNSRSNWLDFKVFDIIYHNIHLINWSKIHLGST